MHKIILIIVSVMLSCHTYAQQKGVVEDTTETITAPTEDTTVVEEHVTTEDVTEKISVHDTSLNYLGLYIPADSINAMKHDATYSYAAYLDSLLKIRKQKEDSIRKTYEQNNSNRNVTYQRDDSDYGNNFFASGTTKLILWILAGLFVLFVLYKLFLGNAVFKRPAKQIPIDEAVEEEVTDKTDIDSLIAAAAKNGNYRIAVRYWYLKSLRQLDSHGLIFLTQDKTNYQYVNELKNPAHRNDFASLTLNYEYVWYGEFNVDNMLYNKIENSFSSFLKKV